MVAREVSPVLRREASSNLRDGRKDEVHKLEAKRNIVRKLILVRLCFLREAGRKKTLLRAGNIWDGPFERRRRQPARPSGGVQGGGANIANSTGRHWGRQIRRLNSRARGCRMAGIRKGRNEKKRQEGKDCSVLEKRALRVQGSRGSQNSEWPSGRWVLPRCTL